MPPVASGSLSVPAGLPQFAIPCLNASASDACFGTAPTTLASELRCDLSGLGLAVSTSWRPWRRAFAIGAVAVGLARRRRRRLEKKRADEAQAEALAKITNPPDDWRFELVRSVGEECQADKELRGLLKMKRNRFILYDGFEPSGRMHIAQGVFKALNVNKCTEAGGTFVFWVADWFALMNDKMGGDLDKIQTVGRYLVEVWKAAGMDMSRVKFLWSSVEISQHAEEYWCQALDIARNTTLARIKKCCQIMGRKEDSLTAAQILYPIMQATDPFFLKADICQLGVDQRKVNMLARDYCDVAGRKKPVILSHHMLYGLKAGQAKMSKSDPDSAIFMEDAPEDVERKIRNAYCPMRPSAAGAQDEEMHLVKDELMNPCLDYLRHMLFSRPGFVFHAGDQSFAEFDHVKEAFLAGEIDETLLKDRLIHEINLLLEPVRHHFQNDPTAKELLGKVRQWKTENLIATLNTRLRALAAGSGSVFAVFAPLPRDDVHLEDVARTLQRLQEAPDDSQPVLWIRDWSAFTLGHMDGSKERIRAFYEFLLAGLSSLAADVMQRVRVCWQSVTILSDPSAYWISVINAGRRCSLPRIRASLSGGQVLEYSSQVVAALMHVGDVLALSGDACDGATLTICSDECQEGLHRLAVEECVSLGLDEPCVVRPASACSSLRLQPRAPSAARGGGKVAPLREATANILLTDSEAEVQRKVKKAFCEQGNADFCPILSWATVVLPLQGQLLFQRTVENGGPVCYSDPAKLADDFVAGTVHPADLKGAVGTSLNAVLHRFRDNLQSSEALREVHANLHADGARAERSGS